MEIEVPGRESHDIQNLVLDLNGTLTLDGRLLAGVADRLSRLKDSLRLVLVTADTHGSAFRIGSELGAETIILQPGNEAQQKLEIVRQLGAASVAAIGNGANDVLMLGESAVGVCVIGQEGAAVEALLAADVAVHDVGDALDLFLEPRRLVATLRR